MNTWYNIVITTDGTTGKMYLNGVLNASSAQGVGRVSSNAALNIGAYGAGTSYFHKGNISNVQIYSKALSAAEIAQNYNAMLSRFYPIVSDADAQAFVVAAGLTSSVQASAVNTLVTSMKTAGVWTKMKAIYPMVGGSAAAHKWNLKDPRDLDAAYRLTFGGTGWVHSSTGALPNGSSDYANTFLNASIMTANSEHLSNYSRTATIKNRTEVGLISYTTNKFSYVMFQHPTSNRYVAIQGGDTMISTTPTTGAGFTISNRRDSAKVQRYLNNSKLELSSTGNGLGNLNYYLSAINGSSYFGSCEIAFGSIGDGLTDAEASSLYTAVQAYQTALGRQV